MTMMMGRRSHPESGSPASSAMSAEMRKGENWKGDFARTSTTSEWCNCWRFCCSSCCSFRPCHQTPTTEKLVLVAAQRKMI